MNNKITNIVLLVVLGACSAPRIEAQTQVPTSSIVIPPQTPMFISSLGDGGVITGQPCVAPCFFNIHVAETKIEQVIPLLENNGISSCSQDSEMRISCGTVVLVGANRSTAIVDRIGFAPSNTIFIQDVIEKYGQPNLMHVVPAGIPEAPTITILLFFDSIKMRIHLPERGADEGYPVSGQTEIEWVTYFDDVLYADIRENMFSQPWNGYGSYQPDEEN